MVSDEYGFDPFLDITEERLAMSTFSRATPQQPPPGQQEWVFAKASKSTERLVRVSAAGGSQSRNVIHGKSAGRDR
jgi:hypothetical protein